MTQEQIKKLEKLKSLLDSGILSQQEFNAEKAKVMSSRPPQAEPTIDEVPKTSMTKNPVVKWIIAAIVIILVAIAMFFAFRTQLKEAAVTENEKSISFISKDSRYEMTVHFGDSFDSIAEMSKADSENIKVQFLGDTTAFKPKMQKGIQDCVERTKFNTGITFNIALNYGGRAEIIKAVKDIAKDVKENKIEIENIDENLFSNYLYTKGQPDPDLLIRTSGEMRLSNFLPWQLVYSEILFVNKYWPDFNEEDLDLAIEEYQKRTRKFGAN
jgi:undecaprenyl diphosphate synthase